LVASQLLIPKPGGLIEIWGQTINATSFSINQGIGAMAIKSGLIELLWG